MEQQVSGAEYTQPFQFGGELGADAAELLKRMGRQYSITPEESVIEYQDSLDFHRHSFG